MIDQYKPPEHPLTPELRRKIDTDLRARIIALREFDQYYESPESDADDHDTLVEIATRRHDEINVLVKEIEDADGEAGKVAWALERLYETYHSLELRQLDMSRGALPPEARDAYDLLFIHGIRPVTTHDEH